MIETKTGGDSAFGFVYVMSNIGMSGLVKVGQSARHPMVRASELSDHSGVPASFVVEFFVEVTDRIAAEAAVHLAMKAFRYRPDREFFRLRVDDAKDAVITHAANWIVSRAAVAPPRPRAAPVCSHCGEQLMFTPLTKFLGGYCACGADVDFPDNGVFPANVAGTEPGLVLPRCGVCRSRMRINGVTGSLLCTHRRCGHEEKNWK